ncbi:MAG: hypothetical protein ACOYEH_07905 [Caldicoprobacterales bacterium]|jgi:hypothetical protein|nr:hypothetical protein [Clostridiales bacterium]
MIRIAFYAIVTLATAALAVLFIYRNKSYHNFMIRQCNMQDEEYDRIYSN